MSQKTSTGAGAIILLLAAAAALFAALSLWLYLSNQQPGDGSAEAGFARDMSEAVMERTDHPQVENLAGAIAASQKGEIQAMKDMLEERGAEAPARSHGSGLSH